MEAALHFKPSANTPITTTKALDDDMDDVEVGSLPVGVEACLAVRRRNDDDRRRVEQLSRQLDEKGKEVNEYDFEIQSPMPPRAGRRRKSDSKKAAPANGVGFPPALTDGVGFPPAGSATPGWLAKAEVALEAVLAEDAESAPVSRSHSVASLVDAIEVERQMDVEVVLVDTITAELALSDRSAGQDDGSNDAGRAEHEQRRREAARGRWGGWRLFARSPTSFERFGEQPHAVDEAAADGEQRQQPMEPPEGGQLDGAPPIRRAPTWMPPLMAKEGGDAPRAWPGAWLRDLFAQLKGRALLLVVCAPPLPPANPSRSHPPRSLTAPRHVHPRLTPTAHTWPLASASAEPASLACLGIGRRCSSSSPPPPSSSAGTSRSSTATRPSSPSLPCSSARAATRATRRPHFS